MGISPHQLDFEMAPWNLEKAGDRVRTGVHVDGRRVRVLVMLCDLTIVADNASFGEPEIRFSSVGLGDRDANDHRLQERPASSCISATRSMPQTACANSAWSTGWCRWPNWAPKSLRLGEAAGRWCRREALYATKLAINRGADAAGFTNRIHIGLDVVAPLYATKTEFGERFREIAAAEGVLAAVRWRAAQFKE